MSYIDSSLLLPESLSVFFAGLELESLMASSRTQTEWLFAEAVRLYMQLCTSRAPLN